LQKISKNLNKYVSKGVTISPVVPSSGEKVTVNYDGLLSKCGASDILVRVGLGDNWEHQYDYRMKKTETGHQANIPLPVTQHKTINMCFKDSANNWDNNSGSNYVFEITQ